MKIGRPHVHILDLTLGISVDQVVTSQYGMAHVFHYGPLILGIDRLAADGHYEPKERLNTRIAVACPAPLSIQRMEISLKNPPVRAGSRSIGVCLALYEIANEALGPEASWPITNSSKCKNVCQHANPTFERGTDDLERVTARGVAAANVEQS